MRGELPRAGYALAALHGLRETVAAGEKRR